MAAGKEGEALGLRRLPLVLTAFRSIGLLDVLSSTTAGPLPHGRGSIPSVISQ